MGYRSDVKLITTNKGWERIDQAVRKVAGITSANELKCRWITEPDVAVPIVGGKYMLAEWNDIKWYEGRDDQVDAVMRVLENLEHDDIPYSYLRIGENESDVERIEYDGEDWRAIEDMPVLGLSRKIEVEY